MKFAVALLIAAVAAEDKKAAPTCDLTVAVFSDAKCTKAIEKKDDKDAATKLAEAAMGVVTKAWAKGACVDVEAVAANPSATPPVAEVKESSSQGVCSAAGLTTSHFTKKGCKKTDAVSGAGATTKSEFKCLATSDSKAWYKVSLKGAASLAAGTAAALAFVASQF